MVRLGIAEAQYEYAAQADDELSVAEGDVVYIDDVLDGAWCQARHKASGAAGLVPANYVEMRAPLRSVVAAYDYEAQNSDELTISEAQPLDVLEDEGEWLLARTQPPAADAVGLVPANYVEEADAGGAVDGPVPSDAAAEDAAAEDAVAEDAVAEDAVAEDAVAEDAVAEDAVTEDAVTEAVAPAPAPAPAPLAEAPTLLPPPTRKAMTPAAAASPSVSPAMAPASRPASPPAADELDAGDGQASTVVPSSVPASWTAPGAGDEIRMWSVSQVDAKKRKRQSKGTLGIGNASVFYVTDQDGTSVPRIAIQDVQSWTLEKNKYLVLTVQSKDVPPTLVFHVGSRTAYEAISARLEQSRRMHRESSALRVPPAARRMSESEMVVVLYDFEAQEHDELSVSENDQLYLVERENDEWWKLQSATGQVGVVPASYVKLLNQPPSPSLVALDLKMRNMPAEEPRAPRPAERTAARPSGARMRTWVDATGRFRVDAELVGVRNDVVRLHKANGAIIDVPLVKMSRADLVYLESVTGRRLSGDSTEARRPERREVDTGERQRRDSAARERTARERQKPRSHMDWFEFFLNAGVDVDYCTRYATSFERDHMDESIVADLDASMLRSLGLKEGDILRVRRYIQQTYGAAPETESSSPAPLSQAARDRQAQEDEALARRLQAQEIAAQRRASTQPPRVETPRAAEPERKPERSPAPAPADPPTPLAPAPTGVDAATIAAAVEIVRQREREEKEAREAEAKKNERPADPNSELFDKLERLKPAPKPAAPTPDPNGPRGPLAPVPLNQSLLQPLIPLQGTGQFVPTQATGMGFMPQPTSFAQPGFMPQPTGFAPQPTGPYGVPQPQPTGYAPQPPTLGAATAETTAATNSQERFSAANVFEQMKTGAGAFGNRDASAPQSSGKYDALRAQPTGFAAGGIVDGPAPSPFTGGFAPMGMMPPGYMPTGYYP
ncbi:cytoskeletal protein binding protein [Malassezia caprae]|uniref:Actin cytoskeleton-regulatory complex protein SLA1 n=1 Tax=Malassezia caprae TaxID=1381934 RepID=A0AAF0IX16_9BASI|nr:cytoskeletal protein binding protein [Malassezia caprae]